MVRERWIEEGWFIRFTDPGTGQQRFYFVEAVYPSNYVHKFENAVPSNEEGDKELIDKLKPLDEKDIFQVVFGVKGPCLIYQNQPTGDPIRGLPKYARADSSNRYVGWIDTVMSPFDFPSFVTEFFIVKGGNYEEPEFIAFNPTGRTQTPELKFEVSQLRVSPVQDPETLRKLRARQIIFRPITMGGLPSTMTGPG